MVASLKMKNSSGMEPCGNKVLIKPDAIENMTGGEHGSPIALPDQVIDRHEASACYGYVVALGEDCFKEAVYTKERLIDGTWKAVERETGASTVPWVKPGDRIAFAIYAGLESTGEDGEKYKTINDKDITARVSEKVTQTSIEGRKPFSQ